MHRHTEPGIVVEISKEGLRRADNDNDLLAKSSRRRETLHAWVLAIALGLLMGYTAAQTAGVVS